MFWGHFATLGSIAMSIALALADVREPLALVAPLALLGLGHGLLMPSILAGTVSLVPALAGAAAAGAGLAQQFSGGLGAYLIGLVPHDDAVNLGLVLFAFMSCSLGALLVLRRVRP